MKIWAFIIAGSLAISGCGRGTTTEDNNIIDDDLDDCAILTPPDLSGDVTLEEGCYELASGVTLSGNLKLKPGVRVYFGSNVGIRVPNGSTLAAEGTEQKRILLSGVRKERAYWQGIYFDDSSSADNRLEHVQLEFAGSKKWSGSPSSLGSIYLTGESRVKISNSLLLDNAGSGLNVNGRVTSGTVLVENTEFEKNEVPITLPVQAVGLLGDGLVFTENDKQEISIHTSPAGTGAGEIQWRNHGVPFVFQKGMIVEGALTLEAGSELVFPTGEGIQVKTDGSFTAVGTQDAPITFRGAEDPRGFWKGIHFEQSASALNKLDHVVIDGAGGAKWSGAPQSSGGVYVTGANARVDIRNTTVSNNTYAGINVDGDGVVAVASTKFISNERGMVTLASGLPNLSDDLVFEGNDNGYSVVIRTTSPMTEPATLHLFSAPYHVVDTFAVKARMDVAAGVIVHFDQDKGMHVKDAGRLAAEGTAAAPIVFRGVEDVVGFWKGIYFEDALSDDNALTFVEINGGGKSGWSGAPTSVANLRITSSSVKLKNVKITKSGRYGISAGDGAVISTCDDVTFAENVDEDLYASAPDNISCPL